MVFWRQYSSMQSGCWCTEIETQDFSLFRAEPLRY